MASPYQKIGVTEAMIYAFVSSASERASWLRTLRDIKSAWGTTVKPE